MLEIRANSARIGDLLGSLTATAYEPDPLRQRLNHTRLAEALTALDVPLAGDLYSLKGAKYCLDTYLNELTEPDFIALRFGALSSARFCKDILDLIPTGLDEASRIQVFRALVNIAEAVDQRVNQFAMRGPMFQLADLLTAEPVDGQNLRKQLLMLPICASTIREHIEILSMDEFKALLGAFQPDGLNAARRALSQFADDRAQPSLAMLNLVSTELDVQFLRRAPSGLMHYSVGLEMALGAGNRLAASNALYRLSLAVKDTRRVFGMLPDYMNKTLLRQVEQSMDLFRDDQTPPVGPLNGQSLRKLDDGIRANLGGAAEGLRSFGLELKPEEH